MPRFTLVNLGVILCIFMVHQHNWPYLILFAIDICQLGLTIWGSLQFFEDLHQILICYLELPILANFMFVLLIIGYIFCLRGIVTIIHFKFGPQIWAWIRRRCPCFRRLDPPVLRGKYPQYRFDEYQLYMRNRRMSMGQQAACPICFEEYQ